MKEKITQKFVIIKVFIQRSASYLTLINAGGLLFLVADRLPNYGIKLPVKLIAPILFISSILLCIILGWIDLKSGVYSEELKWGTNNNPIFTEMNQKLTKIQEEVTK